MTLLDRRTFLARGAAGMVSVAAVERLMARSALAAKGSDTAFGYGPPQRTADQRGRFVLALPAGFSYVTFGEIGSPMSDGNVTPLALDGMAAFQGPGGTVRLIRNHEDRNPPGSGSVGGDPAAKYDATTGGGTSTLDYDPVTRSLVAGLHLAQRDDRQLRGRVRSRPALWLTGEETFGGPMHTDPAKKFGKRHGYLFEVPLDRGAERAGAGRAAARRRAASRTRRRRPTSGPGSSTRPRTRAAAAAPASTVSSRTTPRT